MVYKPSQTDLEKILISLSVASKVELSLPGNWSPTVFRDDLFTYPVETKDLLCKMFQKGLTEKWTYRKFFKESRGYLREESHSQVWDIFDKGQLMMVAENLFLKLIQKDSSPELLRYLNQMSSEHISEWNKIVSSAGACCWEWFLKEPELYFLGKPSDLEILARLKIEFSDFEYLGRAHSGMSRTELIQIFESTFPGSKI